mgnify:CR=1 FL=1
MLGLAPLQVPPSSAGLLPAPILCFLEIVPPVVCERCSASALLITSCFTYVQQLHSSLDFLGLLRNHQGPLIQLVVQRLDAVGTKHGVRNLARRRRHCSCTARTWT